MVVEALLFPLKAEKKPWEMFFLGFLYTSVGILLALWIFRDQASLIMVFMITMASLPIFYNTMRLEESKDLIIEKESTILHEHNKAITFFMYLFVGVAISCAAWYVLLPTDVTNNVFSSQVGTINTINNNVSGNVFNTLGVFWRIFFNNFKVMAFSV